MSAKTDLASQGFNAAEGKFQGAFNSAMRTKSSWDGPTITALISALQRQAEALAQLAVAVGEMDDKLNAIKKKVGA